MTPTKSAADYAAIAVAPLLIFLMISSLANFLMMILYRGGFALRVSWTLVFFTLGAVGIARIAIERDRAYAMGYAGILGFLTFLATLKFIDSPIFSAFILVVIAYLADVIVRDCTLIDDTVDASGQGLIDSGRLFVSKQVQQNRSEHHEDLQSDDANSAKPTSAVSAQQPGRTVMYLALAALPLFGIGQFFLRDNPAVWTRAQFLLALYLFSSLSLLVTTSFLGLRRYLRQRDVEMPRDVSVGWLAGGMILIAILLLLAYLAPLPGRALASIELPGYLGSPGTTEASRFGWGDEGADRSNPDAPTTTRDPQSDRKEVDNATNRSGAPEGNADDGSRSQGPTGSQQGGNRPSANASQESPRSDGGQQQPGQQQSGQQQSGQQQSGQQQSGQQQSGQQQSGQQQSGQQQSGQQQSGQQQSGQQQSGRQQSGQQQSGQQQSGQRQSESQRESGRSDPSDSSPAGDQAEAGQDADDQAPDQQRNGDSDRAPSPGDRAPEADSQPRQDGDPGRQEPDRNQTTPSQPQPDSGQSQASSSSDVVKTLTGVLSMIGSLVKLLIFLVLVGILAAFLWLHRHLIAQWWNWLLGLGVESEPESKPDPLSVSEVPPRAFDTFRNPIGKESDRRRVVVITFQAFDAWTREQGTPRGKEETPGEFIRRIAKTVPQVSATASELVDAYNRVVYGRGQATQSDVNAAAKVWQLMQS